MAIIVLDHGDGVGIMRLGETLRDHGHLLRIVSPVDGDAIPDLDDVDGVVACGGPHSANDPAAWVRDEQAFLKAASEADIPVLGICLGSQMLAKALGGEVSKLEGGPEVGWHEVSLSEVGREDPLFAGLPWRHWQVHWHGEQVAKLPPGARLLGRSSKCGVQAWALGVRTYAMQFHSEVDAATIDRWAVEEPKDLQKAGLTREDLARQTKVRFPTYERLTQRLFENIALLLMPVERRYKGMVKDLHH